MTVNECYTALGGNYADALGRMGSDRLVQKYMLKFLDDGSFELLCRSLDAGEKDEAFRAAHTLKGLCLTLGFTKLADSGSNITEALRSGDLDGAITLIGSVREDYERTVTAIRAFAAQL